MTFLPPSKPTLSLIVAVSDNGVIGRDGVLPWHNLSDLAWFKNMTVGSDLIVGAKTAKNLPSLPKRTLHVVSRSGLSIMDAIAAVESKTAFIIGGAEIYKQVAPLCDRFYISRIRGTYEGDTYYPLPLPWKVGK